MKIKDRIKASQLSQAEVAGKLGVTPTTVTLWCQGKTYPTAERLKRLAALLNCSMDDLV